MVRRFYMLVSVVIVSAGAVGAGVYFGRQALAQRSAVRAAQLELTRSVPVFQGARLKRVREALSERPMADLYDRSGNLIGTVTIHSATHFAVSLTHGNWRYQPATNAQVERLIGEPAPATDENLARIVCHGVGALMRLWPNLPARSVRMDKIEAMSPTSDQASLSFGLKSEGRDLGVSIEVNISARRVLFLETRVKES